MQYGVVRKDTIRYDATSFVGSRRNSSCISRQLQAKFKHQDKYTLLLIY